MRNKLLKKTETNSTAYKKIKQANLKCSACPPNKGCNRKRQPKYKKKHSKICPKCKGSGKPTRGCSDLATRCENCNGKGQVGNGRIEVLTTWSKDSKPFKVENPCMHEILLGMSGCLTCKPLCESDD